MNSHPAAPAAIRKWGVRDPRDRNRDQARKGRLSPKADRRQDTDGATTAHNLAWAARGVRTDPGQRQPACTASDPWVRDPQDTARGPVLGQKWADSVRPVAVTVPWEVKGCQARVPERGRVRDEGPAWVNSSKK